MVSFIEQVHGLTYTDLDGRVFAERVGETHRGRNCTGIVKSQKALRCDDCDRVVHAYRNAKKRYEKSLENHTQKFTPISALKASPSVIEKLRAFKATSESEQKETVKDDEVEVEVRTKGKSILILFYSSPAFCKPKKKQKKTNKLECG